MIGNGCCSGRGWGTRPSIWWSLPSKWIGLSALKKARTMCSVSRNALAWWVETDTRLIVVAGKGAAGWPADADAEFESAVGEQVNGRRLFGQHSWISEVVGQHVRANAQLPGRVGGGHQRGQGRSGAAHVIGNQ